MMWWTGLLAVSLASLIARVSGMDERFRQLRFAQRDLSAHGHTDPEHNIKTRLLIWLHKVQEEGIQAECDQAMESRAVFNKSAVLVRSCSCQEPGATSDFSFTGKFDHDNNLVGFGTLSVSKEALKPPTDQKVCVQIGEAFGTRIESITAEFVLGKPEGKVELSWSEEKLRAELLVDQGIPHGVYKIEVDGANVWTTGQATNGIISGGCWVVTESKIRYGNCSSPFLFENSLPILQIEASVSESSYDPMSVPVSGYISKGAEPPMLWDAHDVVLYELLGQANCTRNVNSLKFRPSFDFDLNSATRLFRTYENEAEPLCPPTTVSGKAESAQALRDYMAKLSSRNVNGYPFNEKLFEPNKARKLLTQLDHLGGLRYEVSLNFFISTTVEFAYFGQMDDENRFHGYAMLHLLPEQFCFRDSCSKVDLSHLFGHFEHGVLQGPVSIVANHGDEVYQFSVRDGIVHGLVVQYGLKPLYRHRAYNQKAAGPSPYRSMGIGCIADFINGKQSGKIWRGMIGDVTATHPFLYGTARKERNITDNAGAYLYPFYESAIVGEYKDSVLKKGRYAYLKQVSCEGDIMVPEFTVLEAQNEVTYAYDPATNESLGKYPTLPDPYESETVSVKQSLIPDTGEGLFLKRALRKGELVALYGGLLFSRSEATIAMKGPFCVQFDETSCPCDKYAITIYNDAIILILPPYDSAQHYNATLARKVNNAFEPLRNSIFTDLEHPRYGVIRAVSAIKDIPAGNEAYIDYGYVEKADSSLRHRWYHELKRQWLADKHD